MTTIDQILADKLASWYVGEWPIGNFILCLIALLLSTLLSGLVGLEREWRGRTAGLRTHLLVGVGSCIIMIISIYGFPNISNGTQVFNRDVARLAAGVIAGVGFLGAGAIIHRTSGTRGLTTAATIWIVMAIGLACGSMNFILAICGTIIIFVVLITFRRFEKRITKIAPMMILRAKPDVPVATILLQTAAKFNCNINDLRIDMMDSGDLEATFQAEAKTDILPVAEFITALEENEGILHVNVMNGHKA